MATVLASVIAVLGTLAGTMAGYVFQKRIGERAELVAQHERLRQERMLACSAFAGAVMDVRRVQYDKWYRRHERPTRTDPDDVRNESYRQRSAAWSAYYRFRLTCTVARLDDLALVAIDKAADVDKAADESDVRQRGEAARACLDEFVAAAAEQCTSPSPVLPPPVTPPGEPN